MCLLTKVEEWNGPDFPDDIWRERGELDQAKRLANLKHNQGCHHLADTKDLESDHIEISLRSSHDAFV